MTGPTHGQDGGGAGERVPQTAGGGPAAVPRCFFDASLLFRCMRMLGVDRSELAADDPLLFRELQARCSLCRSKDECVQDLAQEFDDERWVKWRMYCPNSGALIAIGAVQHCLAAPGEREGPHS